MTPPPPLPVFFVNHGGGPLPIMGDKSHQSLVHELQGTLNQVDLSLVRVILVVSAHFEAPVVTVTSSPTPSLLYDYYGFPPEAYTVKYSAPGAPNVAGRVHQLLRGAGFDCILDPNRGLDHGVFVPLKLMVPHANLPVLQVSLKEGLDPSTHLAVGAALAPLRSEGVLIVGSGMTFHDLRALRSPAVDTRRRAATFLQWLIGAMEANPQVRSGCVQGWQLAPYALDNHPRAEHLVPLFVCVGAAGNDPGRAIQQCDVMDIPVAGFRFGFDAPMG
eukprot:TRINITY_DN4555_c0_g1_i1.p1 TRINITY_DN4555_c0_g1~~TRINITY_DN4555_c0_g1_i1.p1  ORF type:complete len:282 (+),score=44.50 TRINITY_DN4555_c0_g1_i1:26-847(+)